MAPREGGTRLSFIHFAIAVLSVAVVSYPHRTAARNLSPHVRPSNSSGHHSSGGHHGPEFGHHAGQPCFHHHPPSAHHNRSGSRSRAACNQPLDIFTYKLPPPIPQLSDGCCDGKSTGLFADLNSHPPCSSFCDCLNGVQLSSHQCYAGLLFNESMGVSSCDSAAQVTCGSTAPSPAPAPAPLPHLANNGILPTGFYDHNALLAQCAGGTCSPLTYGKLNQWFRYASAHPRPAVDWVAEGRLIPPRYQQGCRGCWAFSAVSAIESAIAINDMAGPTELSVQQVIDCLAPSGDTCEGGDPDDVLEYVARQGAITSAHRYPLSAPPLAAGTCDHSKESESSLHPRSTRISAWERVPPNDPLSLLKALSSQPVIIALSTQTSSFYEYTGGIFDDPAVECGSTPDHNLLLVGYGTSGPTASPPHQDFWIAQNSWGSGWGEGGYIRIARYPSGSGVCGMLTLSPSYPVVDPFTRFSHNGTWVPSSAPPAPSPSPSPAPPTYSPKGHHPRGIGNHSSSGHHTVGHGHHPPPYGHHPAPNGHHRPLHFVPAPATGCSGGIRASPCGGGQCLVGTDPATYTCLCPPAYVSLPNRGDGKASCALEDVCFSSSFNPCGVGQCANDGRGSYTCSCPKGFREAERSVDGTPTCAPAEASAFSLVAHTWLVPGGGQSCDAVEKAAGLEHIQFLYLNPGINCSAPLSAGSVVAVGPLATNTSCAVSYTTTSADSCGSVVGRFGGMSTQDLSRLNAPLGIHCDNADQLLPQHVSLCVSAGTSALVQPCGVYYTIPAGGGISCTSLAENTTALEFFALNPGIVCDKLVAGQEVCVLPYNVGASPCRPSHCPYRNAGAYGEYLYTVKAGDSCFSLAQERFHCQPSMVSCLNYGVSCASNRLLVGQVLCAPSWNPGNKRCQQVVRL